MKKTFTLVELLVVIVILGILIGFVFSKFSNTTKELEDKVFFKNVDTLYEWNFNEFGGGNDKTTNGGKTLIYNYCLYGILTNNGFEIFRNIDSKCLKENIKDIKTYEKLSKYFLLDTETTTKENVFTRYKSCSQVSSGYCFTSKSGEPFKWTWKDTDSSKNRVILEFLDFSSYFNGYIK